MTYGSLFDEVYAHRSVILRKEDDPARRRWQIWKMQDEQGHEPCFRTAIRDGCREFDCPWRRACLSCTAEWCR